VYGSLCVTVNGLSYEKGTVLLRSLAEDIKLVEIEAVAVYEQVKYSVCHKLHVTSFNSHRNAFAIEKTVACTMCNESLWKRYDYK